MRRQFPAFWIFCILWSSITRLAVNWLENWNNDESSFGHFIIIILLSGNKNKCDMIKASKQGVNCGKHAYKTKNIRRWSVNGKKWNNDKMIYIYIKQKLDTHTSSDTHSKTHTRSRTEPQSQNVKNKKGMSLVILEIPRTNKFSS